MPEEAQLIVPEGLLRQAIRVFNQINTAERHRKNQSEVRILIKRNHVEIQLIITTMIIKMTITIKELQKVLLISLVTALILPNTEKRKRRKSLLRLLSLCWQS